MAFFTQKIKLVVKFFKYAIICCITAFIIYPFLHESGHVLALHFFGGKLISFHLFPSAYVVTDVAIVSDFGIGCIGISGIIFPFLVSIISVNRNIAIHFTLLVLKLIVLFSIVFSLVATISYMNGYSMINEDITHVLHFWPKGEIVIICLLSLLALFTLICLKKENVLELIYNEIADT